MALHGMAEHIEPIAFPFVSTMASSVAPDLSLDTSLTWISGGSAVCCLLITIPPAESSSPFFSRQRPHIGCIPIHGAANQAAAAFSPTPAGNA
jgi:hypothetical protein